MPYADPEKKAAWDRTHRPDRKKQRLEWLHMKEREIGKRGPDRIREHEQATIPEDTAYLMAGKTRRKELGL